MSEHYLLILYKSLLDVNPEQEQKFNAAIACAILQSKCIHHGTSSVQELDLEGHFFPASLGSQFLLLYAPLVNTVIHFV